MARIGTAAADVAGEGLLAVLIFAVDRAPEIGWKLVIVAGAACAAVAASGSSVEPAPSVPPATTTPALLRKLLRFNPS